MSASDIFLLAVRWLHNLAAVSWVGGSIFYLLVLRPASRNQPLGWPLLDKAIASDFKSLVDTSILVLIVTGAIMAFDRLTGGVIGVAYVSVLAAKIALALWMFYLVLSKRQKRTPQESTQQPQPEASTKNLWYKSARWLSGYNLIVILGIVVFLLADLLKVLVEKALSG